MSGGIQLFIKSKSKAPAAAIPFPEYERDLWGMPSGMHYVPLRGTKGVRKTLNNRQLSSSNVQINAKTIQVALSLMEDKISTLTLYCSGVMNDSVGNRVVMYKTM